MKKIFVSLLTALPLLLISCDNTTEVGTTLPSFDLSHVYVAGYRTIESDNTVNTFATVWHAGREIILTDGKTVATPTAILATGRKLYVAGKEHNNTDFIPRAWLWNDGMREILSGGTSANGLYVSRDTAYVAGSSDQPTGRIPLLWVKGERQMLPTDAGDAIATAVYVKQEVVPDGKDDKGNPKVKEIKTIYVAGLETDNTGSENSRAVLWTNGEKKALESNDFSAVPQSVFMQDEDLYVTGYIKSGSDHYPVFWKNGVMQIISGPESLSSSSLWIQGKDIYVGGYANRIPVLWENGSSRPLAGVTADKTAGINAICADNADYYAAGYDDNKAVLWLEGRRHNLTDGKTRAEATAICPAP